MKNFLLFVATCLPLMIACTENENVETNEVSENLPSTEVFTQGLLLEPELATRAAYQWPLHSDEGWETARFSIRVDGTIPDHTDKSSALYWGRFAGGNNKGKIWTIFPFDYYDDRGLDYYKKDKKTGENTGLFRYVYDAEGLRTQLPIMEYPLVEDILTDELETNKKADEIAMINELLAKGSDYLNSHVLWYVVKEVGMQYGWHVNGVFVDYEMTRPQVDASRVPDNVEVDIHQQEHQDWNEIKTSVHIRTDAESVTINLPISEENIIEQDDFDIRVYNFYFKEYIIKHQITHDAQGITIQIYDIPAELINQMKAQFGDGLTVEVHSYCRKAEGVWEELKKSTVATGKACTLKGQVTSAFTDEKVVLDNP